MRRPQHRHAGCLVGSKGAMTAASRTQDDMTARRVGVVLGGWGGEEDVSLEAGEAIAAALQRLGHEVTRVHAGAGFDQSLRQAAVDVAFCALQGRVGHEGRVQGDLQVRGVPFTGSGALASALAADKGYARRLFKHFNLATAAGYVAEASALPRLEALHGDLGFPVVVKAGVAGTGAGVALVERLEQLRPAVERACRLGGQALVERYVKGREVTVAILDGEVLGAGEVSRGRGEGSTRLHSPPRLSPTRVANLEAMALTAWRALGCRGAVLVDFICPEVGNEVLLGLDAQPSLAPSALLPRLARANGLTFDELCERLLDTASLDAGEVAPVPVPRGAVELRPAG